MFKSKDELEAKRAAIYKTMAKHLAVRNEKEKEEKDVLFKDIDKMSSSDIKDMMAVYRVHKMTLENNTGSKSNFYSSSSSNQNNDDSNDSPGCFTVGCCDD